MKSGKIFVIVLMVMVFLLGLATFLYPHIRKTIVDATLRNDAQEFIDRVTVELWKSEEPSAEEEANPTEPVHKELLQAMQDYYLEIWNNKQAGL